jgi:hypothetical protein
MDEDQVVAKHQSGDPCQSPLGYGVFDAIHRFMPRVVPVVAMSKGNVAGLSRFTNLPLRKLHRTQYRYIAIILEMPQDL